MSLSRRQLLLGTGGALTLGAPGHATVPAPPRNPSLRVLGESPLPHRLAFQGTTVGGLSGLDYDPTRDLWIAISDARSQPRCYTLRLPLSDTGLGQPELLDVIPLDAPPHPDAEAVRWLPQGGLLWSSEGDVRDGEPPGVHVSGPDGRWQRSFTLPAHCAIDAAKQRGPRHNRGFEGLALTPDGRQAWATLEGPLRQDGPPARVGSGGGPCRFTLFDIASGRPVAQRAYQPEPIPPHPLGLPLPANNGVSEILMLDARRMLVLERAYMPGVGTTLRLFRADLVSGDDTLAMDALAPGRYRPLAKTLVADLSAYLAGPGQAGLSRLDNSESLAFGPLVQGRRTLVLLSDDNFNPLQVTQCVAFILTEPL